MENLCRSQRIAEDVQYNRIRLEVSTADAAQADDIATSSGPPLPSSVLPSSAHCLPCPLLSLVLACGCPTFRVLLRPSL